MTIHQLTQQEADKLMKSLDRNAKYYKNFYEAFHEERTHVSDRNKPWALPEPERSYYLIESYLFGVNFQLPDNVNLSSFARILPQTPRHNCASCLTLLLRQKLIPLCQDYKKRRINAALTENGKVVFARLKKDFPGLEIGAGTPYHHASLPCEDDGNG